MTKKDNEEKIEKEQAEKEKQKKAPKKPEKDIKPEEIEAEEKKEEVEEKPSELEVLTDKYLRLVAEYDNYRKRTQNEKKAIFANSVVTVMLSWLPVIDDMERGLEAARAMESEDSKKIADGMEMVLVKAREAMSSLGVEEIKALGEIFDPNTMDAVMHRHSEDAGENEVVEVLKKGYIRADKVIRHAMVIVAN